MSIMYRRPKGPAIALAVTFLLVLFILLFAREPGGLDAWEQEGIPGRVASADDLARRAVPGWKRAEAQGLVVPIGVTADIPYTKASVTFEKAWYSGRQAYILFTIRAPEGEFVMPTWAFLSNQPDEAGSGYGQTEFHHLRTWGGFSPGGFHSVLLLDKLPPAPRGDTVRLEIHQWAPVSPEKGIAKSSKGLPITVSIPWNEAYLQAPAPEVYMLKEQQTWLERTVTLDELEVGIGRMELTGSVQLPEGESNPGLISRLRVGDSLRDLKEFEIIPGSSSGFYQFVATFDGPDVWPAPVSLDLSGITFQSNQTLEWRFPWATKRSLQPDDRLATLSQEEQVSVHFYDSTLQTVGVWSGGVAVEQKDADGPAPRVVASLSGGGRIDATQPGMEIATPSGKVVSNLGGGSGVVWDRPSRRNVQGISANWWDAAPSAFEGADYLTLRYVHPGAFMTLNEKWTLPLQKKD
ncbi:MAG: hypothetical protein ACYC5Y_08945 [Symbiobacteriia bacterium]